jgi:hypothetical protein
MNLIDWILFVPLACCVGYLLTYAVASLFYQPPQLAEALTLRRFAVLFPAYKEDRVIVHSVESFLQQAYPREMFHLVVVADQMLPATNEALARLPIRLLTAHYNDSSKAKALQLAMKSLADEKYDAVVVMDADNRTTPQFLYELNRAFEAGYQAVQAHRTAKASGTPTALLDAVSEEINNGIFRRGHNVLGLSAALSGSGMALDAQWFTRHVDQLRTAGEDKELEVLLLRERIHIGYLAQTLVYDEKTRQPAGISRQRRRWMATQYATLRCALPGLWDALRQGNADYCDKLAQWLLPPRLLQPAMVFAFTAATSLLGIDIALKWWILSAAQVAALLLPIPRRLWGRPLLKALAHLPGLTLSTLWSLTRLKDAHKKFIHTEHHHENSH